MNYLDIVKEYQYMRRSSEEDVPLPENGEGESRQPCYKSKHGGEIARKRYLFSSLSDKIGILRLSRRFIEMLNKLMGSTASLLFSF